MADSVLLSGVIGHPIGHSLSPRFQNAAFADAAPSGLYLAWDVDDSTMPLTDFVNLVRHDPRALFSRATQPVSAPSGEVQMLGFNATLPHKETLLIYVDRCDPLAAAIGAVNMIVVEPKTALSDYVTPRLLGYNTDAPGLRRALVSGLRAAGIAPESIAQVLLLGASGAARGAAYGLLAKPVALGLPPNDGLHIRNLFIANRSHTKATALVAQLAADPLTICDGRNIQSATFTDLERGPAFDLIINATSLGVRGEDVSSEAPVQVALRKAKPGAAIYDLVYRRGGLTPFLAAAKQTLPDAALLDGLTMLLWQGALAFERWTGIPAPLSVMAQSVGLNSDTLLT